MKRYKWLVLSLAIIFSGIAFIPVIAFPWTEKIDWQSFALAYNNEPVIFYVTTTVDEPDAVLGNGDCKTTSNECSLRAAIDEANLLSDLEAEVIIDLPSGNYTLSEAHPVFTDFHLMISRVSSWPVIIRGHGIGNTIIEGDGMHSIFKLQYTVEFRDVTIQNGGGGYLKPGAIMVDSLSDITLKECVLKDNNGYDGGAININGPESYLKIQNCTITANTADNKGGAIYSANAEIIIRESTISDNVSTLDGGGIYSTDGTLKTSNTTISGNSANSGGGFFQINGRADFFNTTIHNNSADLSGGGIRLGQSTVALVWLYNSILGGNVNVGSPDCFVDNPGSQVAIMSNGTNLIGSTLGCQLMSLSSDKLNVDPKLGPLQNNGGPTFTHGLLPGSPAIDGGRDFSCIDLDYQVLSHDQRWYPRLGYPGDTTCDIGAYEWNGAWPVYLPVITR